MGTQVVDRYALRYTTYWWWLLLLYADRKVPKVHRVGVIVLRPLTVWLDTSG